MARNRAYSVLWASRGVATLGDSMWMVVVLLAVADGTGQALAVAALLLVGDFAPALLSPVTGTLSDRFNRRAVLIASDLFQSAVIALTALWMPPLPVLLVLVGLRALAAQTGLSASRAVIPALVPDRGLEKANASLGLGTNGAEALGLAVTAVLIRGMGGQAVLVLAATTFLLSALLLTRLPRTRSGPVRVGGFFAAAREGTGVLFAVGTVRIATCGFIGVVAFNGVDDVALVFFGRTTLHASESAVALLFAAIAVGLLGGYLVLLRSSTRPPVAALLLTGFALSSAGNLCTGLVWVIGAAIALQTVRGVGLAMMDLGITTVLQREIAPHLLGRAFGNLYGSIGAAAALSYIAGAITLELTDPRLTLWAAGSGGLVVTLTTALAWWQAHRRIQRRAPGRTPRPR